MRKIDLITESCGVIASNQFTVTDLSEFHDICDLYRLIPNRVGKSRTFSFHGYDCHGSINGFFDYDGTFKKESALNFLTDVVGIEDVLLVLEAGYDKRIDTARVSGINFKRERFHHDVNDYRHVNWQELGFLQQDWFKSEGSSYLEIPSGLSQKVECLYQGIYEMPESVIQYVNRLPDNWYIEHQDEIDLNVNVYYAPVNTETSKSLNGLFGMGMPDQSNEQADDNDIEGARVDLFSKMYPDLVEDLPFYNNEIGRHYVISPTLAGKITGKSSKLLAGRCLNSTETNFRVLSRDRF